MPDTSIGAAPRLSEEEIDHVLQQLAGSFVGPLRAPVMHPPAEQGHDYEEVTFPLTLGRGRNVLGARASAPAHRSLRTAPGIRSRISRSSLLGQRMRPPNG